MVCGNLILKKKTANTYIIYKYEYEYIGIYIIFISLWTLCIHFYANTYKLNHFGPIRYYL